MTEFKVLAQLFLKIMLSLSLIWYFSIFTKNAAETEISLKLVTLVETEKAQETQRKVRTGFNNKNAGYPNK